MEIFLLLISKMMPLYLLIILGYIAGKFLNLKKENIAPLLIYIIAPFIVFNTVYHADLNGSFLLLPFIFLIVSICIGSIFYKLGKFMWKDETRNILGFAAGSGNTGYFGLPVAIALFGESVTPIAVMMILGIILYENTWGYFLAARAHYSPKLAFMKLLRLPSVYAFLIAIILNVLKINVFLLTNDLYTNIRGTYTVLGMMLIGVALSSVRIKNIDYKFNIVVFIAKFIVWPIFFSLILYFDHNYLHLFNTQIYKVFLLMSIVPIAANTVAFASELKAQPEKAAISVLLSTIFALIYIPIFVAFFIKI